MQPTLPQAAGTADMDLTAVQSMDWFFKKEQIYLLAQFWQQRATLAEKEVNTLKEQLSTNTTTANADVAADDTAAIINATAAGDSTADATTTTATTIPPNHKLLSPSTATTLNNNNNFNNNNTKLLNSVAAAITLHQNGGNLLATTPSPSPPLSDGGNQQQQHHQHHHQLNPLNPLNGVNGCLNPKLFFNHAQQMMMEAAAAAAAAAAAVQQQQHSPMHSPQQQQQQPQPHDEAAEGSGHVDASKLITSLTAEMNISKLRKKKRNKNLLNNDDNANAAHDDANANNNDDEDEDDEDDVDNEHDAHVADAENCVERTDDTSVNVSSSDSNNSCSNSKNNNCSTNLNCTEDVGAVEATTAASLDADEAATHKNERDVSRNNNKKSEKRIGGGGGGGGKDAVESGTKATTTLSGGRLGELTIANNHAELLAAKDKEIKALFEEVQRLRALEQTHIVQIHRLEEHLEAKRQHIVRLETHLDEEQINAALTETTSEPATAATTTTAAKSAPTIATESQATQRIDDIDEDEKVNEIVNVANKMSNVAEADEDNDEQQMAENAEDKECENFASAATATTAAFKIKKENQSPLDLDVISPQSAIAVAAAAAAACANDPNKFQELLLERTKALAAVEALKSTEGTTVASNEDDDDDDEEQAEEAAEKHAEAAKACNIEGKAPKIEIEDDDDDDDVADADGAATDADEAVATELCNNATNAGNTPLVPTIDVDELESVDKPANRADTPHNAATNVSPANCFDTNMEHFGSLLGEELVNSYWRHGFKLPATTSAPATGTASTKTPTIFHQNANQQQQQQMLLQHNAQQHQHLPPLLPNIGSATAVHHHQPPHHHAHHQSASHAHHLAHQAPPPPPPPLPMPPQPQHGPSSTALLSQLVNSTFSSTASSSLRTDAHLQHHHHHHHHHQQLHQQHLSEQHEKSIAAANHQHDSSSSGSTPNLMEARASDEHSSVVPPPPHPLSLNGGAHQKSLEDNNNSLCATPTGPNALAPHHLPHGFLPGLPFQFQERGHFRFAEDIPLPPGSSMAGRLGESLIPKGDPMEAKLQEMLRYNMDKYANQALDTLHISRRVRELLSVHNIGQRLFAKYILGLSQGTVSELLSKPKPWDKLTEKGRDSYRKMHAWGCDDNAVMLLKSLIPKKDSGLPQYGGRNEDSMSDDRIAHILNEASSLMKNTTPNALQQHLKEERQLQQEQQRRSTHEESHSNEDSKSPHQSCTSPFYKDQLKQQLEVAQQQQQQQQQHHQQQQHRMRQEELTQDKMTRLYQEIMARTPRETAFPSAPGGMPPASLASNAFPAAAAIAADENIRLAFEREMAKFQQQQQQQPAGNIPHFPNFTSLMALQQQVLNGAQDLSLTKDPKDIKINGQRASLDYSNNSMDSQTAAGSNSNQSAAANTKDMLGSESERNMGAFHIRKQEGGNITPAPQPSSNASAHNTNSAAPSPLSNSILPPAMTTNEDFSAAASPLQRMASITNSLITQPPVTPHHSQPQRPTKAVLPPITQQQFDMFNNLNTEDIVRRVKEALSQYSISQRLFGESVLGLSQGSVSDLLARPKPWHMLTQKGREPFIRMKMFLEDENAVHKLVASQYKIAPEKLMRTGSYSGSPQIPQGIASKMQATLPMQKMMNELKLQEPAQAQHIMQQMQAAAAMSAAMQQQQQQQNQQHAAAAVQAAQAAAAAQAAQQHHQSMLLTSPGLPPQHAISLPAANAAASASNDKKPMMMPIHSPHQPNDMKPMMMPIHSPHQANAMRNMHQHMSPTVYEMAALTQDLDTQVITTKIKEALLANNIGQKIFGEAVLGLSQGSVSELLSKPKPWHMLSIKGREPFIRMQLWLSDPNNVERLQVLKNERREASKRRRSTGPNQQDNSSDTSSNDTNDFYTSSPGPGSVGSSVSGAPPNKKQRVLFSEEQKEALRLAFALDPYPNVGTIEFLANELSLATRTITNWFHNHRMRLKQQVPHGQPSADNPIPSRENTNSTPFDPNQFRMLLQQRLFELHKERMGLSGAPIPYPPYFAAAALLGRSLAGMPGAGTGAGGEPDLHALNQAFKEQMSGLDLSMSALKREHSDNFEDDLDESHLSDNESLDGGDGEGKGSEYETPRSSLTAARYLAKARSSRRKPAAPQWVNPAGAVTTNAPAAGGSDANERIINGVCVMQGQTGAADFSRADEADGAAVGNAATDKTSSEHAADAENETSERDDDGRLEIDQRFMEPEVRIKQEEDNCDSDNETTDRLSSAAEKEAEEKLKVLSEEKLRLVRVASRLSNEDELPTAWNY